MTADNEIIAYSSRKGAEAAADLMGDDCHGFDSVDSLEGVLASGPSARAAEIWNGLPGVEPVKGFKSKGVAAGRIFKQLKSLGEPEGSTDAEAAEPVAKPKKAKRERKPKAEKKPRKSAKKATITKKGKKRQPRKAKKTASSVVSGAQGPNKRSQVIEMISKKGGASLESIMEATGWLRHTCRGMLATLKTKGGLNVESFKCANGSVDDDGQRRYRIA